MRAKKKCIIGSVLVLAVSAVGLLIGTRLTTPNPQGLSLTFQRYSKWDAYLPNGEFAFLWLTNSSEKSYQLQLRGNTNTVVVDTSFGQFKQSWLVNCEFSDITPIGRSNYVQWVQPGTSFSPAYFILRPHTGCMLRVPVPPRGTRRRVAALCQQNVSLGVGPPWTQNSTILAWLYWSSQSLRLNLFAPQKHPLRVWCEQEIQRVKESLNYEAPTSKENPSSRVRSRIHGLPEVADDLA